MNFKNEAFFRQSEFAINMEKEIKNFDEEQFFINNESTATSTSATISREETKSKSKSFTTEDENASTSGTKNKLADIIEITTTNSSSSTSSGSSCNNAVIDHHFENSLSSSSGNTTSYVRSESINEDSESNTIITTSISNTNTISNSNNSNNVNINNSSSNNNTTSFSNNNSNSTIINRTFSDSSSNSCIMRTTSTSSSVELNSRRVSFPKSDNELVTGYLEPANPWDSVHLISSTSELLDLYKISCNKHNASPLDCVIGHLRSLKFPKNNRQSVLNLRNHKLTPESCEPLEEIFKRVQYEKIDLAGCQLDDTAASALFDMIEYYEAANEIDISENPKISTRGLQSCISMIRKSRALQVLTIRGTAFSELNASNLGKSLNNSCLHTIKLEHCGLTGRPMSSLCTGLRKNTTLRELWLAHNDLTSADAEKIANLLKINGHLELLDISNNNIKDDGVKAIVTALINQATNIYNEPNNTIDKFTEVQQRLQGDDTYYYNELTGKRHLTTSENNVDNLNYEDFKSSEDISDKSIDANFCGNKYGIKEKNASNYGQSMLNILLNENAKPLSENNKIDCQKFSSENKENEIKRENTIISECKYETTINNENNINSNEPSTAAKVNENLISSVDTNNKEKVHYQQHYCDGPENNNRYKVESCKEENSLSSTNAYKTILEESLDVNKNNELEGLDPIDTDSAFESASEGDMSQQQNISKLTVDKIDISSKDKLCTSGVTCNRDGGNSTEAINRIIGNNTVIPIPTLQLSDTRPRSFSNDSLSSENSIEAGDLSLLEKMNEKFTKNDTLTRQKQPDKNLVCFKKPKGLQALILWNNNITRESGEYISDLLHVTNTIELLNIGKNILSNDFIEKIKESLKLNKTLINLGLQSAHLSCAGIKSLSSAFSYNGNCTLERIDIRDNRIQVEGLTSLAEMLKFNKCITRIDVDDYPKRISSGDSEVYLQYSKILQNIRSLCSSNQNLKDRFDGKHHTPTAFNRSGNSFVSRKISLTCPYMEPIVKTENLDVFASDSNKKPKTGSRLRSPLPSPPIISPSSSPVPSPSRSRFQVFRVMENTNPNPITISTSENSSNNSVSPRAEMKSSNERSNLPSRSPTLKSRFHVTIVKNPPTTTFDSNVWQTKETSIKEAEKKKNNDEKLQIVEEMANSIALEPIENEINNQKDSEKLKNLLSDDVLGKDGEIKEAPSVPSMPCAPSDIVTSDKNEIKEEEKKRTINLLSLTINIEEDKQQDDEMNDSGVSPDITPVTSENNALDDERDNYETTSFPSEIQNQAPNYSSVERQKSDGNISPKINYTPVGIPVITLKSDCNIQNSDSEVLLNSEVEEYTKNENIFKESPDLNSVQKIPIETESNFVEDVIPKKCCFIANVIQTELAAEIGTECTANDNRNISPVKISALNDELKNESQLEESTGEDAVENQQSNISEQQQEISSTKRTRKLSWIPNPSYSSVDKFLNFLPSNLFNRSSSPEQEKKDGSRKESLTQTIISIRKPSPPNLFSWSKLGSNSTTSLQDPKSSTENLQGNSNNIPSGGSQSSFLDAASKQIKGLADFGKQVFRSNNISSIETGTTLTNPQEFHDYHSPNQQNNDNVTVTNLEAENVTSSIPENVIESFDKGSNFSISSKRDDETNKDKKEEEIMIKSINPTVTDSLNENRFSHQKNVTEPNFPLETEKDKNLLSDDD